MAVKMLLSTLALILGVTISVLVSIPRIDLPRHLLNHTIHTVPDMLTESERVTLMNLLVSIGSYPTNLADTEFYKAAREDIGEAIPFDGSECGHPLLVPNRERSMCVLAGRVDIGRHFILHGGFEGVKESYEKSVSRLLSFGHYAFNLSNYPPLKKLFESERFLSEVKHVCPASHQYLDPFQFNFIIQIPGQSVALHVDGVYFWNADRFSFPQWLLAAMKFSGLFEDRFIHQIQVVAYLHNWSDDRKGDLVYYNDNEKVYSLPPTSRFGIIMDGSKVVHAASIYRPEDIIPLDRNRKNVLRISSPRDSSDPSNDWEVFDGYKVVGKLKEDDLRISLVYRARCFRDAEEKEKFTRDNPPMELDTILEIFTKDLNRRGFTVPESRLELSILIMDVYIRYPLSDAFIPYNYCAIPRLAPRLKPFFDLIC